VAPSKPTKSLVGDDLDVLVQSVYQQIKDSILDNRLRPGTKLTHQMLAEMLGVSRTPVRESLERLYQEGYVSRIANRGHYVAEINSGEVRDLYETREALETFAVQLLFAKGRTKSASQRLIVINTAYRKTCEAKLTRQRLQLDREFHLTLAGETGNHYLVKMLGGVFDRLILKRRIEGFQDLRGMDPYDEHIRLVSALGNGDKAAALDVLTNHIGSSRERFAHYLEVERGANPGLSVMGATILA
jgi:DNA-binding GntR family transcriptional regulator